VNTATQKVFFMTENPVFTTVDIYVRFVILSEPSRIPYRPKTAQHTEQTSVHKIHGFTSK